MGIELEESSLNGSITLCICTMNRAEELSRCLESVFQSVKRPDEVIVSDDSPNEQPARAVVAKYPQVIYQSGPRRGLGPNRNACIQRARGSHIIFIDDDVCVPPEFFATARGLISSSDSKTIITGYQMDHGDCKIVPQNADFWGLQRVPVSKEYRAIVINATIFPKSLFEQALFDEHLRYGSEELDIAQHAVALGYQIAFHDCLYVNHYPSPVNRQKYKQFIHASRLYVTTKAYWQYERSLPKTLAYIMLAPLQLAGSAIRKGDVRAIWGALQATTLAWRYFLASPTIVETKGSVDQK